MYTLASTSNRIRYVGLRSREDTQWAQKSSNSDSMALKSRNLERKGFIDEFKISEKMLDPLVVGDFCKVSKDMGVNVLALLSSAHRLAYTHYGRADHDICKCHPRVSQKGAKSDSLLKT